MSFSNDKLTEEDIKAAAGNETSQAEALGSVENGEEKKPERDMKAIRSKVLSIALPALVELTLMQLVSMADTMMVGRLGPWAISAVGYCVQPRFMLLAVFIALNTGATALIARFHGEENRKEANSVLQQSILMTFLLSILISIIGFYTSRPMAIFMGATEEHIIGGATVYMQIQMAGFVFTALTMATTACLRGIGKTKVSMVYNLIANGVNIVFNYLLIYGKFGFPKWEVAGASIATVMGQIVAFSIAMLMILKVDDYLRLELKKFFTVRLDIIKRVVRVGLPAMGEQLIMRTGMIIYIITITSLGSDAFATHQIASSILTLTFMTGQAFGISATSLVGQSLGRRDPEEARISTLECRRYGLLCSIVLVIIFVFFGRFISMLYTDNEAIIAESAKVLLVVAFIQPMQTSQLILSGALRGAGDTMVVAVISFIGVLLMRPLLSLLAVNVLHFGLLGAWVAMIVDQAFRSLISYFRFKSNKWAYIKV